LGAYLCGNDRLGKASPSKNVELSYFIFVQKQVKETVSTAMIGVQTLKMEQRKSGDSNM
jgi:hypothetical protein